MPVSKAKPKDRYRNLAVSDNHKHRKRLYATEQSKKTPTTARGNDDCLT